MGEAVLKIKPVAFEEYLQTEPDSPVKREYVDGQLHALAGAGDTHSRIVTNLIGHLWGAARGGDCRVYASDMKLQIRTQTIHRFYYPDVMVTCYPEDNHEFYKVSPCLIAEVLSPSTRNVDKREKLLAYQGVPTLQSYLLIEPGECYVEHYRRDEEGAWWYHELRGSGTVKLVCPELELSLADIYEGL